MHVDAGWSSLVARRAHNPKVVGSNPAPATIFESMVTLLINKSLLKHDFKLLAKILGSDPVSITKFLKRLTTRWAFLHSGHWFCCVRIGAITPFFIGYRVVSIQAVRGLKSKCHVSLLL